MYLINKNDLQCEYFWNGVSKILELLSCINYQSNIKKCVPFTLTNAPHAMHNVKVHCIRRWLSVQSPFVHCKHAIDRTIYIALPSIHTLILYVKLVEEQIPCWNLYFLPLSPSHILSLSLCTSYVLLSISCSLSIYSSDRNHHGPLRFFGMKTLCYKKRL